MDATSTGRTIEEMGLFLSEDMKSHVDDVRFWCMIRGNVGRITDAVKEIFVKVVMDPYPSPRTNLILWWLVVIIHSQVLDSQPECPVGGPIKDLVPNLSFDGKLKVLNHYARILTLEVLLHSWEPPDTINHASASKFLAIKREILERAKNESTRWGNQDAESPLSQQLLHEEPYMRTQAWQECLENLRSLVDAWLVHDCYGPIREILGLLEGLAVTRGDERRKDLVLSGTQPSSQPEIDEY